LDGQEAALENGSIRSLMKGNVLVLTVSRLIWSMSMSIVFPFLSLYIIDLGGTKPIVGMVNALGSVAGMVLFPLGGYLADKAGRAKFVGIATFLFASSFLLFIFAPNWQWLAIGVVYQQVVLFYMPALNAIMADSIPVGARGRILSLTIAIPEAVRILIPSIGGWLIATYTLQPAMRVAYTFSLITGAFVGFLRYRYLEETIENGKIDKSVPQILKESYVDVFKSMDWVLSTLRGYAIIAILITLVASIVQPFWIIYASEVIGLTPYEWGLVLLGGGLVKTVLSFVIGGLVDRLGPRRCILISLAVTFRRNLHHHGGGERLPLDRLLGPPRRHYTQEHPGAGHGGDGPGAGSGHQRRRLLPGLPAVHSRNHRVILGGLHLRLQPCDALAHTVRFPPAGDRSDPDACEGTGKGGSLTASDGYSHPSGLENEENLQIHWFYCREDCHSILRYLLRLLYPSKTMSSISSTGTFMSRRRSEMLSMWWRSLSLT
jgi:DHA1 family multidrug resistance protein-like MFS transporter